MSDTHKYWPLTERLGAQNVPYSIEDTGSAVMGLFIPDGTSEFSVSPTEDGGAWLVLRSASREDWWNGKSSIIDEHASTDEVMKILTEWGVVWRHRS